MSKITKLAELNALMTAAYEAADTAQKAANAYANSRPSDYEAADTAERAVAAFEALMFAMKSMEKCKE